MTPATLQTLGEALYGALWMDDLATDLGVTQRAVRYWASGERGMPADLAERLKKIAVQRIWEIRAAWAQL